MGSRLIYIGIGIALVFSLVVSFPKSEVFPLVFMVSYDRIVFSGNTASPPFILAAGGSGTFR